MAGIKEQQRFLWEKQKTEQNQLGILVTHLKMQEPKGSIGTQGITILKFGDGLISNILAGCKELNLTLDFQSFQNESSLSKHLIH